MIRNTHRLWFEIWGSEAAQNQFLKGLLVLMTVLVVALTVALIVISTQAPTIISISENETRLVTTSPPTTELLELEMKRVVNQFMSLRHTWDATTIETKTQEASKWIATDSQAKFLIANAQQVKIAKEKRLSQRFHIFDVSMNPSTKQVRITGDRVLIVDNLRAATQMTFELKFDYGPRTATNPEGLYITSEELIPPK